MLTQGESVIQSFFANNGSHDKIENFYTKYYFLCFTEFLYSIYNKDDNVQLYQSF